jgi:transposase
LAVLVTATSNGGAGCDPEPVREFGNWTADLMRMADWLKSFGVREVVRQSTCVCWIALYDVLDKAGFQVCRTNVRDTKNLLGRMTDARFGPSGD